MNREPNGPEREQLNRTPAHLRGTAADPMLLFSKAMKPTGLSLDSEMVWIFAARLTMLANCISLMQAFARATTEKQALARAEALLRAESEKLRSFTTEQCSAYLAGDI